MDRLFKERKKQIKEKVVNESVKEVEKALSDAKGDYSKAMAIFS